VEGGHYALTGWESAQGRRDAQDEFHEAAPPAPPWRLRCGSRLWFLISTAWAARLTAGGRACWAQPSTPVNPRSQMASFCLRYGGQAQGARAPPHQAPSTKKPLPLCFGARCSVLGVARALPVPVLGRRRPPFTVYCVHPGRGSGVVVVVGGVGGRHSFTCNESLELTAPQHTTHRRKDLTPW
jgi:hypothetical protein